MTIEARIQSSFARQGMMATLEATLDHVAPGAVSISAPLLPKTAQQHGFAHAGLTFSIGDSAGGYAALTLLDEGQEIVTAEIKINLLAPARGTRLIARGRVLKPGRRLIVIQSDVFAQADGAETQVATLLGTMVPVTP